MKSTATRLALVFCIFMLVAATAGAQQAPPEVKAVAKGSTTVVVTWSEAPKAIGYNAERQVQRGLWEKINKVRQESEPQYYSARQRHNSE